MKIEEQVSLAQFTTLRVGGPVDFFVRVRSKEDVKEALDFVSKIPPNPPLRKGGLPVFIIGGGSNILFADAGFRGLIIKNEIQNVEFISNSAKVGSGTSLAGLVMESAQRGLAGLENLAGVPGTIGGAVVGNANEIGNLVKSVTVLDASGKEKILQKNDLDFSYRDSSLKKLESFLVEVELELQPTKEDLQKQIGESAREKVLKHPYSGTAGSWFKNPSSSDKKAWELIDEAGCRGLQVGGAQVSEVHANFFQNTRNATAADFLELEKIVQEKVMDKFGVELEREIIVLREVPNDK